MTCPPSLYDLPFVISLNFLYKLNKKKKKMLLSLGYNNKLKTVSFFLIGGKEEYHGMSHFKVQNTLEASMYNLKKRLKLL